MSEEEYKFNGRYMTIKTYAEKAGVSFAAISMRLKFSEQEKEGYKEGQPGYLEQTLLEEAEGVFIDSVKFPPKKIKRGRRSKI